ncbi:hypothetical protein VOM14_11010 [Paraburkholderia sp. MPAMCS5]|uniref:hypothetical protein n=1 Tax=Paraburkholderia sp. MPAMCS5 TaxID=3112563 RepID=UPI002E186759|nr:hypothetical protein [Paraburkholderia sp. MPAMCS5]
MPKTSVTPFSLAERAIINLYDGGVLSPAVLERLIAAFALANPQWDTEPIERTVDGRSLHEVVALTMLPGESLRSARKSFMSVIEHIAGAATMKNARRGPAKEEPEDSAEEERDSAELEQQLSGRTRSTGGKRSTGSTGGAARERKSKAKEDETSARPQTNSATFNLLLNAAAPRKSRR